MYSSKISRLSCISKRLPIGVGDEKVAVTAKHVALSCIDFLLRQAMPLLILLIFQIIQVFFLVGIKLIVAVRIGGIIRIASIPIDREPEITAVENDIFTLLPLVFL